MRNVPSPPPHSRRGPQPYLLHFSIATRPAPLFHAGLSLSPVMSIVVRYYPPPTLQHRCLPGVRCPVTYVPSCYVTALKSTPKSSSSVRRPSARITGLSPFNCFTTLANFCMSVPSTSVPSGHSVYRTQARVLGHVTFSLYTTTDGQESLRHGQTYAVSITPSQGELIPCIPLHGAADAVDCHTCWSSLSQSRLPLAVRIEVVHSCNRPMARAQDSPRYSAHSLPTWTDNSTMGWHTPVYLTLRRHLRVTDNGIGHHYIPIRYDLPQVSKFLEPTSVCLL